MKIDDLRDALNDVCMQCLESGKIARRIMLGPDAYTALIDWLGTFAQWAGAGRLQYQTIGGGVEIEPRVALYRHVILEAVDGSLFVSKGMPE